MFVMLLRNIRSFVIYNEIKIQITRIVENVLKIEIIVDKSQNINILISRISLYLKKDEINKNRKKNCILSIHETLILYTNNFYYN